MKWISAILILATFATAQAADKVKWYFNNEEITKVIELYSKASGQKFVVSPGVRGKVSLFNQEPISIEEAFNQLSSALALNGFAISKQQDTMVVQSARLIQRSFNQVSADRPSIEPERMYTWIYTPKYISVVGINRDLRIFPSRDGEMSINPSQNQLILSDWSSNINRVADLLALLDKPLDPATTKIVEAARKDREKNHRPDKKIRNTPPPPLAPEEP